MKKPKSKVVSRTWTAHFHRSLATLTFGVEWEDETAGHGAYKGQPVVGVSRHIYFSIPFVKLHVIRFSLVRPAAGPQELMAMLQETLQRAGFAADITFQQPTGSIEDLERRLSEWRNNQKSAQPSENNECQEQKPETQMKWPKEWEQDKP